MQMLILQMVASSCRCAKHRIYVDYLVIEPTKVTATTARVPDQVLTNSSNFVKKINVTPPISTNDYCTVGVVLNFKVNPETAYLCMVWQYEIADLQL